MPLTELIYQFEEAANPENARAMASYMKDHFSFLGIKKPNRAAITKIWLQECKSLDWETVAKLARQLWDMPHREYQYLALDMLMKWQRKAPEEAIRLYADLIVHKSWWDTVDMIASNLVGTHCSRFPEGGRIYIDKWRNDPNMWLVRTTLIFQLKYKDDVDSALLASIIEQHAEWDTFFIKKAIGWALRQYSKYNPEWVHHFISQQPLSKLSKREAEKYL